jgi:cytochrome P450
MDVGGAVDVGGAAATAPDVRDGALEYTELTFEPVGGRFAGRARRVPAAEADFNHADRSLGVNPYPQYARLRERQPVLRHRLGFWVLSRYEDCQGLLKNSSQLSSDTRNAERQEEFTESSAAFNTEHQPVFPNLFWDPPRFGPLRPFLLLDEPDHKRLRSLVGQAFTRSTLTTYQPRLEQMVEEMLDRAMENEEVNFVREFSYPLPVTVICELLGIPTEDEALFGQWSRPLANTLTPDFMLTARQREASRAALIAMIQYLLSLIVSRRGSESDDLLGALIAAEAEGERLTEPEVVATVMVLLMAGHETTVNLISNGLLAMLANRDQAEILAADEEISRKAVDETLRFDAPVQTAARSALADVEIDGHRISRGEHAVLLIGSANRDPAMFADPDSYDVMRPNASRHIGFGTGIHACVGSPLARMEGQVALRAIAQRLPGLELAQPPFYRGDPILRGPDAIFLQRTRGRTQHAAGGAVG